MKLWGVDGSGIAAWGRRTAVALALCALLLASAGCANETPEERRSYGHDGYMGLSNSNPNTINRHSTLSYGEDVRLIEQVLEPVEGIRDLRVSFNGSKVNVTVVPERGMDEVQAKRLRAEAQAIVQSNMPRYDIHVKVSK